MRAGLPEQDGLLSLAWVFASAARLSAGAGLAVAGLLNGCAVHEPRPAPEPVSAPAAFLPPELESLHAELTPDRWWVAFGDRRLDDLQERALSGNFSLAAFRDRLRAARAIVRRERSFLSPTLDASAFFEQGYTDAGGLDDEPRIGASLLGAYELDVWGGIEAGADAAALRALLAEEELTAAAVDLSARVALTWYALVEQLAQRRLLDAQVETNAKVLRVVEARFAGGAVRASDVLRQRRLLESTREQRATVRSSIETLEHALLVLTGRSPTGTLFDESATPPRLPELPPRPALGVPAGMVRRRPDVRAAHLAVLAADRDLAVAIARRYPSVRLRLDASTVEDQVADLFDDWLALFGVDVIGPIFDGGRREAAADAARAARAERVSLYGEVILAAFGEVVDAVARESARAERIDRLGTQLDLARRTSERLNREYLNGDISYIDVLDALTTEQRLQRELVRARSARIADRIGLHRALAGGWPGVVPPPDGLASADASISRDPSGKERSP